MASKIFMQCVIDCNKLTSHQLLGLLFPLQAGGYKIGFIIGSMPPLPKPFCCLSIELATTCRQVNT